MSGQLRGISISYIFKMATNMTKIFIVIPGIILTWSFSAVFLGFQFTLQAVLAIVIIFCALYLYASQQPTQEQSDRAERDAEASVSSERERILFPDTDGEEEEDGMIELMDLEASLGSEEDDLSSFHSSPFATTAGEKKKKKRRKQTEEEKDFEIFVDQRTVLPVRGLKGKHRYTRVGQLEFDDDDDDDDVDDETEMF